MTPDRSMDKGAAAGRRASASHRAASASATFCRSCEPDRLKPKVSTAPCRLEEERSRANDPVDHVNLVIAGCLDHCTNDDKVTFDLSRQTGPKDTRSIAAVGLLRPECPNVQCSRIASARKTRCRSVHAWEAVTFG